MKLKLSTVLYIFSFMVVFPLSLPLYILLAFMGDDPSTPTSTLDMIYIGYLLVISILGSTILNGIFRVVSFEKNNKYTWVIFIAHLILIPVSAQYIYPYILF